MLTFRRQGSFSYWSKGAARFWPQGSNRPWLRGASESGFSIYRVAADVHLIRNLALRLALDLITGQDLVSFYHSFHFVGPS